MKLSIVVVDGTVIKNSQSYLGLDLSLCTIPETVVALQWYTDNGQIEYQSAMVQNEDIVELPLWANNCLDKWQSKEDDRLAEEAAAKIEAEEMAQAAGTV